MALLQIGNVLLTFLRNQECSSHMSAQQGCPRTKMKYWTTLGTNQTLRAKLGCQRMMVWHNFCLKWKQNFCLPRNVQAWHKAKGFPDLRNVSLVHRTIYYIGIIYFVSSDIWLLSSGINRQLIVAGIHIYKCYSVLQCSCCCMWFLPFVWVSYSCFPTPEWLDGIDVFLSEWPWKGGRDALEWRGHCWYASKGTTLLDNISLKSLICKTVRHTHRLITGICLLV